MRRCRTAWRRCCSGTGARRSGYRSRSPRARSWTTPRMRSETSSGCTRWAAGSRSTTTAPAIRRSPICAGCRCMSSRSTNRLSSGCPPTPVTPSSSARPSTSRTTWACRWWPKASRTTPRSIGCAAWAATWCKAIFSAVRWAWLKRPSGCAPRYGQDRRAKRRACAVWSSCAAKDHRASRAGGGGGLGRDVFVDPLRERLHELVHELPRCVVGDRPRVAEHLGCAADIGLGLRHGRNVEEHQRLAKVVIGAERAQSPGREAENRSRLAVPRALAVGTRGDVDRVLEHARHRAVVLRRDEQHRVGLLHAALEILDLLRRVGVEVLVVMRQLADLDDLELQRLRRHGDHRLGHLAIERFLAKAADDDGHVAGGAHDDPFKKSGDRSEGGAHERIIGDRRRAPRAMRNPWREPWSVKARQSDVTGRGEFFVVNR